MTEREIREANETIEGIKEQLKPYEFLLSRGDVLLPVIKNVIASLETIGEVIEPLITKVYVQKMSLIKAEKFKALTSLGFTREEAMQIIIGESKAIKDSFVKYAEKSSIRKKKEE